jgi:hypothetical protein
MISCVLGPLAVMVRQKMGLDPLGWCDRCLGYLLTDAILRGGPNYQFH